MKARNVTEEPFPQKRVGRTLRALFNCWVHRERTRWDPKDGELFPVGTKPEETPVEVRSDSDVQIGRLSWV